MPAPATVAFWDPTGDRYGIPTYPWRQAPDGYATRRQLAARRLRPGGQHVQAQVLWRTRSGALRVAYLYEVARALPKRTPNPGAAGRARQSSRGPADLPALPHRSRLCAAQADRRLQRVRHRMGTLRRLTHRLRGNPCS
jgi:hypothetical protein